MADLKQMKLSYDLLQAALGVPVDRVRKREREEAGIERPPRGKAAKKAKTKRK